MPLSKCKIEKVLSNKLFKIICKQEVLLVYSEMGDSEEWITALQNAVKKVLRIFILKYLILFFNGFSFINCFLVY